jgi:hypothetical protein
MPTELRIWKAYATLTTLALAALAVAAWRPQTRPADFDTLTARRINIVGPDGALQMVISNRQQMPEGKLDGKTYQSQGRHDGAGMIFYNALGDENGGLTFGAKQSAAGYSADSGLMFDQFKQDQTVGLTYTDENGRSSAGLRVWQRPTTRLSALMDHIQAVWAMPEGKAKTEALAEIQQQAARGALGAARLFAGRTPQKDAAVVLDDAQGHPRLRLQVSAAGVAEIEFLDAQGKVLRRLTATP